MLLKAPGQPVLRTLAALGAFFLCLTFSAYADDAHRYQVKSVTAAIKRAKKIALSESAQWKALLHYSYTLPPFGTRSIIDNDSFFLSSRGKTSSEAELEATIAAIFSSVSTANSHPQCLFPARTQFLRKALNLDELFLPRPRCPRFEDWREILAASGLTLIFPSSYLNNPASAFGHTLLRLDQAGDAPLVYYAANFSANTYDDNAIVYALKGIFGGYVGYFTVAPYYELANRYGDVEHRDIWEYKLNVTPEEVQLAVAHLWELRNTGINYYYFDDNCSSALHSFLRVVKPALNELGPLPPWIIPLDSVTDVSKPESNLVATQTFRPSLETTLLHRADFLTDEALELAKKISSAETSIKGSTFEKFESEDRSSILEFSYDYLRFLGIDTEESKKLALSLLVERSKQGPAPTTEAVNKKTPVPPHLGHDTLRLSLGAGMEDTRGFLTTEARAAYHGLLDPAAGYQLGTAIEMGTLQFRGVESERLKLEEFYPLLINSLTPANRVRSPISWNLELGIRRQETEGSKRRLVFETAGGLGRSLSLWENGLAYLLLGPQFQAAESYSARTAFGWRTEAGSILRINEDFILQLKATGSRLFWGEEHSRFGLISELGFKLGQNLSLRAGFNRKQEFKGQNTSLVLNLDVFI